MPAIEVDGLGKQFGTVVALDHVSFTVQPGELFFLLGPSGCGKTTLLRILAGLEEPSAGSVRFAGKDITALPAHRRGAPMVFQNYAIWPHLSVAENIAFGLVEAGIAKPQITQRVADALEQVGLTGLGARMPGQLSGGQQQRVALARALVVEPSIILLDEPLSNLDAKLRHEMRDELARLHEQTDITFVYVTHDQSEALTLADRIAVLEEGRLRALGTPAELYHRPPNLFCADFLGEANLVDGQVETVADGQATLKGMFGTWQAVVPAGVSLASGDAVHCLVRPENLRPGLAAAGANALEATVQALRMNGATMRVELEATGQELKASVLNRFGLDLAVGSSGPWHVAVDDTVALDAEESGR